MRLNGATIPDTIVERVIERRGAEHSFADFDPARTALVVIDLQHAFMNDAVGFAAVKLWPDLDVWPEDEIVRKYRYSAFMPGTSELPDRLRARGFDTVLITGTVTNVCCESSARDANMTNFRTIMVSDGNAALSQEEHDASLAAFYNTFGDVMDTDMIIASLRRSPSARAA